MFRPRRSVDPAPSSVWPAIGEYNPCRNRGKGTDLGVTRRSAYEEICHVHRWQYCVASFGRFIWKSTVDCFHDVDHGCAFGWRKVSEGVRRDFKKPVKKHKEDSEVKVPTMAAKVVERGQNKR